MNKQTMIFTACGVIAAAALVLGVFTVAAYGFEPPPWLLGAMLAILAALALACGFTAVVPAALPYLRMRAVQGSLLVVAGVMAVFVPAQFVASAVLLAFGSRLVWREACRLADQADSPVDTAIVRPASDNLPVLHQRPGTPDVLPCNARVVTAELVRHGD